MKFDSEGLWRHASNVAYALNKAYECLKAKKQNDKILQSYIEKMDKISEECTKMTFIENLTASFKLVFDSSKYPLAKEHI